MNIGKIVQVIGPVVDVAFQERQTAQYIKRNPDYQPGHQ